MKYIYCLLTIMIGLGCGGPLKMDTQCELNSKAESRVYQEFSRWAEDTMVCTYKGGSYYFMTKDTDTDMEICKPNPKVLSVRCYPRCNIQYYICSVRLNDGYDFEASYKFSEVNEWEKI